MTETPDAQRGQEAVTGMYYRGPILRVDFSIDGMPGHNWNTELRVDNMPATSVTDRQLDDAVLAATEFRDTEPIQYLRDYRSARREIIRQHFLACAQKMVDAIEAEEPWEYWLGRLLEQAR